MLDTAADAGASGLYEAFGYNVAGVIPDYAYKPLGGLTGAKFYWKQPRRPSYLAAESRPPSGVAQPADTTLSAGLT